jgi:hypothetical protein
LPVAVAYSTVPCSAIPPSSSSRALRFVRFSRRAGLTAIGP